MAATVSAWSKPGAWALDSEENEDHLLQQHHQDSLKSGGAAPSAAVPDSDFPSLAAVATTKAKKKKPQTLSLQEFSTYSAPSKQRDEVLVLPTAPRERTEEELNQSRLGGGFRSYDSSRGSRGGEERRRGEERREFAPSRADETDNWGAGKKTVMGGGFERRGERGERGGFFGDSQSRADEVDNWGANKVAFGGMDSGRRMERRGVGFESNGGGADSESWGRKKEVEGGKFGSGGGGGGAFDSLRTRRGSNESVNSADSDSWGRKREEVNGNGVGGRPRLNLQPRTKPLDEVQKVGEDVLKAKAKALDEGQKGGEDVVKPKAVNPFGEARPREEVLKEKGQDWKEIDEKLEAVKSMEIKAGARSPDGKKGFGFSNDRGKSPEGRTERAWRKPDAVDPPRSETTENETTENGHAEEPQDGEPQA